MRRLVAAAALVLAACAGMHPIEPPKVAVSQVEMDRLTAVDARFNIVVRITNPNDRVVAVDAIVADLSIENVPIGRAVLAAPVLLPAHGETSATIAARADYAASLRASAEIARKLGERPATESHVQFAVSGTATLDGGVAIPFSRSGAFTVRRIDQK